MEVVRSHRVQMAAVEEAERRGIPYDMIPYSQGHRVSFLTELIRYLKDNPCELDNLAHENPDRVRRMSRQLLDWHNALPGADTMPAGTGSFDYPWPGKK